ncbi:MAG: Mrr restriction system protein, partial [Candidatus Bathyarchaeota archaeon]|nr:Mrr restriction system protein [Candidatus Bathyarchaeota archaeon]
MLPKQKDVEVPLLEVLVELGGQATPKEIYPVVTRKFPEIRTEDLIETLPSGGNRWTNRIQWVRQRLIDKGEMYSPSRGIWAITEKGRKRVATKEPPVPMVNFIELYEDYETSLRSQLLDKLAELSSRQFELFAKKLLQAYGFVDVKVTNVSLDGGIDGYGKFRL